jgi:hypothetical protein
MEWLQKLLSGENFQWLVVAVFVLNAALSGLSLGLEKIGKIEMLPSWVKIVAEALKKIIDIISANIAHK